MGDVDEGRVQALVQFADERTRFHTQLGIQVGEWLIQQEDGRLAHDGPAEGDALPLTAG